MAEDFDSPIEPERDATSLTPRARVRREAAHRPSSGKMSRTSTKVAKATPTPAATARPNKLKPLRTMATLTVVAGLIATVALPAYGAWRPAAEAVTLQQIAQDGAQSLVVASAVDAPTLQRDTYSATTPEEIEKKKAAEAAAARARQAASFAAVSIDLNMVGPGTGAVRWPLAHINYLGEGFGARGGAHQGLDILTDGGTPIFAVADGVVRISAESSGGYGVCVSIDSVIGGKKVTTIYAHMRYGSRQVQSGQSVKVGQVLGLVGSTGRSTANHLHLEVLINGTHVDPHAWLNANAG